MWCELGAQLGGERWILFGGLFVDDGSEIWFCRLGRIVEFFEFGHFEDLDGFDGSLDWKC